MNAEEINLVTEMKKITLNAKETKIISNVTMVEDSLMRRLKLILYPIPILFVNNRAKFLIQVKSLKGFNNVEIIVCLNKTLI